MNEKVKKNQKIWPADVIGGWFQGLNRTSFQACGSICNKSKLGWDMKFF